MNDESAYAHENDLAGKVILLVEDNLIVAMAAAESFTMMGVADVLTANSPEKALRMIDAQRPDVAVLDINLGSDNSFGLARQLRDMDVPFIFASGYGDQADRPDDLQSNHIITKPYRREQLAVAISALLSGRQHDGSAAAI